MKLATGRLAALITDGDRREELSFALQNKFFLMAWPGKNVRDAVAILSALGVLVATLYGFVLLLRTRRQAAAKQPVGPRPARVAAAQKVGWPARLRPIGAG